MSDADFLTEAVRLSVESVAAGGGPFGAVIVMEREIVGRGANRVTASGDPTAHAEIVAIRDACARLKTFELRGAALYSSCEPCPMCLAAAYWARLETVIWAAGRTDAADAGFDDAFLYDELTRAPAERRLICRPSADHRESACEAFKLWKALPDKTSY